MYPIGKIANSYKAATGILPTAAAFPKRTSAAADWHSGSESNAQITVPKPSSPLTT